MLPRMSTNEDRETEATRADPGKSKAIKLAVLVAALGYFVDIYDLILFSIVRVTSLRELGIPQAELLDRGVLLINMQMGGMLFGGLFWGILGDKRGRLSVLFGSIVLYSLANIANGFVSSLEQYAAMRFIAGVGLAGELGAGITLVSEVMQKESRGYGTTIVATVGICGAVVAALVGDMFHWRTAYFVGGALGLSLLVLRIGVTESGMFTSLKKRRTKPSTSEGQAAVSSGDFFSLFSTWDRARRYVCVILTGVPIWYAVGILITFSPEIGKAMGMTEVPKAGRAVMFSYIGLALGDLGSGVASQWWKSRKKVVGLFLLLTAASVAVYFTVGGTSLPIFYLVCSVLGFATGYWAVFVTMAAEQFGTNIRATATTTAPNFVRGFVVPLTLAFQGLTATLGIAGSAIAVGVVSITVALLALRGLDETYGKDLDFLER
jgi:MFS transporter, putative metabolite:H+ symporter